MKSVDKLNQERERGLRAQAIAEDPLFVEAFESIDEALTKRWASTAGGDKELREELYLMKRLMIQLRQGFVTVMTNGKHAAKNLDFLNREDK